MLLSHHHPGHRQKTSVSPFRPSTGSQSGYTVSSCPEHSAPSPVPGISGGSRLKLFTGVGGWVIMRTSSPLSPPPPRHSGPVINETENEKVSGASNAWRAAGAGPAACLSGWTPSPPPPALMPNQPFLPSAKCPAGPGSQLDVRQ